MNKFVLVSDIHGNYPALQAVVDEEGADMEYMVLGDIHGLHSYPKETLDLVRSLDGFTIAGNHDKAIFHHGVGHVVSPALSEFELSHTINSLEHEQIDFMQELPFMEVVQRGESRICLTHAYPFPERASGYERGNAGIRKKDVVEIASIVADDYDYVFHGHTHEQYSLNCSDYGHDVHFVNPGTLGYDGDYAVVDTDEGDVTLKSIEYDWDMVRKHIKSVIPDGMPHVDDWLSE